MAAIDTSLLSKDLIFLDFEANSFEDFFEKMSDILMERGYVKEGWKEAILEREKNFPTGLDCEAIAVALPHVDPQYINKAYIAVTKPKAPIVFNGMAGTDPVSTQLIVNLGLLAHEEDQVAVLQAFLGIFMDADACKDILSQSDEAGMLSCLKGYIEKLG